MLKKFITNSSYYMDSKTLEIVAELMQEIRQLTDEMATANGSSHELAAKFKEKSNQLNLYLEVLNKRTYHFFVGGPPGAGKSAFVGELKSAFPYAEIIASGNICRNLAAEDSERGHEIARYVKAGELAPLHLFVDVITEKLHQSLMNTHVIIWDGFPRTYEQVRLFAQLTLGGKVAKILKDAPETEIMGRILNDGRKQCTNPNCGIEYPSNVTICKVCGSPLIVRPDDNPVVWLKRLRYHLQNIAPMQDKMYADLSFISGDREGHQSIIQAIRKTWRI